MSALLVDDQAWIPDGFPGFAALGPEWLGSSSTPDRSFEPGESVLFCVERVLPLGESRPDILVAVDQIACLDPTLIPVRDPDGRAAFPEMSEPFDVAGSEKAVRTAEGLGLAVRCGCLAGLRAPDLLTPAERSALVRLGADAACRWLHLAVRHARAAGTSVVGIGVRRGVDVETIRSLISDLL